MCIFASICEQNLENDCCTERTSMLENSDTRRLFRLNLGRERKRAAFSLSEADAPHPPSKQCGLINKSQVCGKRAKAD